jgi:Ca2+-binding RTX toxin-like protein
MPRILDRNSRLTRAANQNEDLTHVQFARVIDQFSDANAAGGMPLLGARFGSAAFQGLPDNYQPVESAWYIPGPTAIVDVYEPTKDTTGTLVVDGAHVIAACDTPGDNDWFAVTLTAGQTYQFGQYAYAGGIPGGPAERNNAPLADAYLEIYDSTGNNLLAIADGGGPNTPSGLDALMTFEAPYSGTFYVNATSYDNDGDGVGDFAGDYEIFAITATGTTYTTHYDISSPLHSIDWGGVLVNREHVSVRNPDGMEGPRPTGEPAADPATVVGNALGYPGKNVIYLYFAGEGDTYANADSTIPAQVTAQDPYQYEIQAMLTAANEFSKVADVVFVSNYTFNAATGLYERDPDIEYKPGPLGPQAGVQYATGVDGDGFDADFFYWSYPGTPGPGISLLGSMSPPDYGDEGTAQFNSADERWTAQMLQQGGFSFTTLIHEFGHGMGLAHPHDTGGGSSVMHGVQTNGVPGDDGGAGDFDLNQGVNTMMSYNDGWEKSPYGQADTVNEGYGWLGSLMALDIAVIQDKYGVNEDWATGNDTYVLKDVNEWGVYIDSATGQPAQHNASNQATARDGYYEGQSTYYSSIWDANGNDSIVYNGARNTNIDLRAATLQYEYGGAGWMSYATGIYGGFTIANGVTIENAFGGSGNDVLIGNGVANYLYGGAGVDNLTGGGGNDFMVVTAGDSVFEVAGGGYDNVLASESYTLNAGAQVEILSTTSHGGTAAINLFGNDFGQVVIGNAGVNYLFGGGGADALQGLGGNDFLFVDANDTVIEAAGGGYDNVMASESYALNSGAYVEVLSTTNHGGTGAINLFGNELGQIVIGNAGANYLFGGGGADTLQGLGGDDFLFVDGNDSVIEAAGGGYDNVLASEHYTLNAGAQVEILSTTNHSGTAAINLTGNELDQQLIGNAGANVLNGGLGADSLVGFAGADSYAFTTALGGGNVDTVSGFVAIDDTILLDDAVFTALSAGALNPNAFVIGTAAGDADDRIIYNNSTGALFYDADGNGSGAAVQFATLQGAPTITASDFAVI